jgi:hypothetical protein
MCFRCDEKLLSFMSNVADCRYENVIIMREEGRMQFEPSPKKLKKHKGIHKSQTVIFYQHINLCNY